MLQASEGTSKLSLRRSFEIASNKKFIRRKVSLIQKDLDRLGQLSKFTLDEIMSDFYKANTLDRLLEKIIGRAIDINQHVIAEKGKGYENIKGYEDTFHALAELGVYTKDFAKKIAPSAGLRNRIAHEYDDYDEKIVYESIKDDVKQYVKYCDSVLKHLEKN